MPELTWKTWLAPALAVGLFVLAGCDTGGPKPDPTPTESANTGEPAADASATPDATASQAADDASAAADQAPLDWAALTERESPDRLLRFYASAMHKQNWAAAALAWDGSAHITAEILKKTYDRGGTVDLAIGKGTDEAAAGSMFYEAPVVLDHGDGSDTLRGTITVRRANDVPGASEEALSWRIERSTIGPQL
ncbi:MAG: hypothetical protein KDE55_12560 [Novosphingobium sp.]|nr:hypothetical protein [Novosphingobium sp.]